MCRMMAITATNISPDLKKRAVDRSMLVHMAQGNLDGWGICDGKNVFKSSDPYMEIGWEDTIDAEKIIFGHVRYASNNAGLSMNEAHPFLFDNLTGQHNGLFLNTGTSSGRMPNSDSWRALKRLSEMMGDGELTAGLIGNWLSTMWNESTFAVMLYKSEKLYVVRNISRDLYYATLGNGYVISTTLQGIEAMRALFKDQMGDALPVPVKTLMTFEPGQQLRAAKLNYTAPSPTLSFRFNRWIAQKRKKLTWLQNGLLK